LLSKCVIKEIVCNDVNHIYLAWNRDILIYLLTAIGISPGCSTHLHTNNTQNNTKKCIEQQKKYIEQQKYWEEGGPCPAFAGITLAFALQLRKKHGKTSVRVVKNLI
jgi:hypothetical protein